MKKFFKKIYRKLYSSKISIIFRPFVSFLFWCDYHILVFSCKRKGNKMPNKQEIELVKNNVTFIYKSFERQRLARKLYKNIQKYYPGVKVIVADDSKKPLKIKGEHVEVLQLPFNTGLSYGLNRALEKVTTPYLVKLDDDELLTPSSNFHKHLQFLFEHPEVDLCAILFVDALHSRDLKKVADRFFNAEIKYALKPLLIPARTPIDATHIVSPKTPQIFIARTEAIKAVGYDDNIRICEHHEFFIRASGNIVSVIDPTSFVFHGHNLFNPKYNTYRNDCKGALDYMSKKIARMLKEQKDQQTQVEQEASQVQEKQPIQDQQDN